MTREYICLKEDEGNQLTPRKDLNISTLLEQILQPIEINLEDLLEPIKYPPFKISATINKFDTIDNFMDTELLNQHFFKDAEELLKPRDTIFAEFLTPEFEYKHSCMVLTNDGWVQGC